MGHKWSKLMQKNIFAQNYIQFDYFSFASTFSLTVYPKILSKIQTKISIQYKLYWIKF